MKILFSAKFEKEYMKLPKELKHLVRKKITLFIANPFDSRLDTHKLHGALRNYFAFSINNKYRIVFSFAEKDIIKFHFVGSHDIY